MVSHLAGPLPSLFHPSKIITVKKLASRISEEKRHDEHRGGTRRCARDNLLPFRFRSGLILIAVFTRQAFLNLSFLLIFLTGLEL